MKRTLPFGSTKDPAKAPKKRSSIQTSIKDSFKPKAPPKQSDTASKASAAVDPWIQVKDEKRDWVDLQLGGITLKFPFQPYNSQKALMSKMLKCIQDSGNACLESPTGILLFNRKELERPLRYSLLRWAGKSLNERGLMRLLSRRRQMPCCWMNRKSCRRWGRRRLFPLQLRQRVCWTMDRLFRFIHLDRKIRVKRRRNIEDSSRLVRRRKYPQIEEKALLVLLECCHLEQTCLMLPRPLKRFQGFITLPGRKSRYYPYSHVDLDQTSDQGVKEEYSLSTENGIFSKYLTPRL
jgi:hypothetical protein